MLDSGLQSRTQVPMLLPLSGTCPSRCLPLSAMAAPLKISRHTDCGVCHLAHSYAVHPANPAVGVAGNVASIVALQGTPLSFLPDGPERPKWESSSPVRRDA